MGTPRELEPLLGLGRTFKFQVIAAAARLGVSFGIFCLIFQGWASSEDDTMFPPLDLLQRSNELCGGSPVSFFKKLCFCNESLNYNLINY